MKTAYRLYKNNLTLFYRNCSFTSTYMISDNAISCKISCLSKQNLNSYALRLSINQSHININILNFISCTLYKILHRQPITINHIKSNNYNKGSLNLMTDLEFGRIDGKRITGKSFRVMMEGGESDNSFLSGLNTTKKR